MSTRVESSLSGLVSTYLEGREEVMTDPYPLYSRLRAEAPVFAHPIAVESGEIVEREGFIFADVLPAGLL